MSIPLISNLAFTEVNSSGNLNEKISTELRGLPVQFFQLTANVSGNLTMSNNTAHKKIIIDTNGYTIINPLGSPLTNNSSSIMELKGSGNVQSTLKTFTVTETSTTYTGTTSVTVADNSTIEVNTNYNYTATNQNVTFYGVVTETDGSGNRVGWRGQVPTGTTLVLDSGTSVAEDTTLSEVQMEEVFGTVASPNFSTYTISLQNTSISPGLGSVGTISGSSYRSIGGISTNWTGAYMQSIAMAYTSTGSGTSFRGYRYKTFKDDDHGTWLEPTDFEWGFWPSVGYQVAISNFVVTGCNVVATGRNLIYTNKLSTDIVLSGTNNPFSSVTVTASAIVSATRNSTDGSFSVTGTISGNNGDGRPYALVSVNDGSGSIATSNYSGTLSINAA